MSSDKHVSEQGLELLMELEGCKQEMYLDAGGKETIGVGHLITDEEQDTGLIYGYSYGEGLTREQCLNVLALDLKRFEDAVNTFVYVPLTQYQFDALVIFAYNVGRHAFKTSTLVKVLNRGLYNEVPAQLRRWNKVNGKVVGGLVERRRSEIEHWRREEDDDFVWDDDDSLEDIYEDEYEVEEDLLLDEGPVDTASPESLSLAEQQSGGDEDEGSSLTPSEEA